MASVETYETISQDIKDEEEKSKFVIDLDEVCAIIYTPGIVSITDTQKQTLKKNVEFLFENCKIKAIQLVYILLSCLRQKDAYVEQQVSQWRQESERKGQKIKELETKQQCYSTLVDELNSYKKSNQALLKLVAKKRGANSPPEDDSTSPKQPAGVSRSASSHSSWERISRSSQSSSCDGHMLQAQMELNEQHSKLLEQVDACNNEYIVKIKTLCRAMCNENAELKKALDAKDKSEQQAQSEIASLQSRIKEMETIGTQTSVCDDDKLIQLPSVTEPPTTEEDLLHMADKASEMRLAAYKQRVDSLEYKVKELTEANSSWVTYRDKIKTKHSAELAAVKDAYDDLQEQLQARQSAQEKFANDVKLEKSLRKQLDEKNATLRVRVDRAEKTTRELKQEVNEKAELVQRLSEKIRTLESEREEYVSTYSSQLGSCTTKSRAELIEQVTMYQHTAEVYKSDFLRERGDRERAFSEIADLRVKFRDVAQKLGDAEHKLDRAKEKIRKLTDDKERLEIATRLRDEKYRKIERKYQASKLGRTSHHHHHHPTEGFYKHTLEEPTVAENRLSDITDTWTCNRCTFKNSNSRINCELCGTKSPAYEAIRQGGSFPHNIEPSDICIEEYRPRKQQGPPEHHDEI